MSEFGRLRKHEKPQHALVGLASAALTQVRAAHISPNGSNSNDDDDDDDDDSTCNNNNNTNNNNNNNNNNNK